VVTGLKVSFAKSRRKYYLEAGERYRAGKIPFQLRGKSVETWDMNITRIHDEWAHPLSRDERNFMTTVDAKM
jgi:hypothetical protein